MDAANLITRLQARSWQIATAESCTGGLLAAALTAVPGSSACFGYGLITYSNEAKERLLGVLPETVCFYGAVSRQTAEAMAQGLRQLSQADLALTITGIAGPDGGSAEKPVGLVYICLMAADTCLVEEHHFHGNRQTVREASVAAALALAEKYLDNREEI